jgi:hypothetical protein
MRGAALLTVLLVVPAGAGDALTVHADPIAVANGAAAAFVESLEAARETGDAVRIRDLVAKLGSSDFREREAAGKQLAREPDRALPAMRQALRTLEDPEAARRLEVLVKKLHTARLVSPKRVTFSGARVPIKGLLAEIAKQTGYKLNFANLGESEKVKLSVKWAETPFWLAIDEICNATGLQVNPEDQTEEGTLSVFDNDSYNPHVCYAGPFRMVATNIGSNKNVQLSGLPRRMPLPRQPDYLNLNFQIQSEPKNPIVGTQQPELTKAVDDTGASLIPPKEDEQNRSYFAPYYYRGFNQYAGLNLVRGGRNATVIKELRGKVTVMLLSDTRPEIVVENLLAITKKKKFVGRSTELEIESAAEANGSVTVNLTARQLNPNPEDYSWMNTVFQRLEVVDDAGVKWTAGGVNNQNNTPGAVALTLTFMPPAGNRKAGKPSRLQFVEWVTHPREVEFLFKDIPLP